MDKRDRLIGALLAAALLAWLIPFARIGVDAHHDGIMLKPALDVLSGQTLFRDTFMQYGALSCYLQVAALFFQPTLLCLKLMTALAYAATLYVLYLTWRLFLPRSLALLSAGFFMLLLPAYERNWLGEFWIFLTWSSVLAMFFQALVVHALARIIRDEQATQWGMLLGMACAGVLWCRQPVGVVTIGAVAAVGIALHLTGWTPVKHSKREILLWTLGGLLGVNLLLLGSIVFSGSFHAWWYQNFTWPRKWAFSDTGEGWGQFFEAFLHPWHAAIQVGIGAILCLPMLIRRFRANVPVRTWVVYYVVLGALGLWQWPRLAPVVSFREGGWTVLFPILVTAQALVSVVQGFAARTVARPAEFYIVAALAAVSLSSVAQYYPVPDSWHVFWALAPTFGVCAYVAWRWTGASATALALVVAAILVPSVYTKIALTRELLSLPYVTLESPAILRGMRVSSKDADHFAQIMRVVEPALKLRPDIAAEMTGRDALYLCFVNNRVNGSAYFVTWPGLADAAADKARWDFADRYRPLMFFHRANWTAVNDFYRRSRYVPLLYQSDTAMEVAVPQELADAMGLKMYGANPPTTPAPAPSKP